jgi:hypothetical protein
VSGTRRAGSLAAQPLDCQEEERAREEDQKTSQEERSVRCPHVFVHLSHRNALASACGEVCDARSRWGDQRTDGQGGRHGNGTVDFRRLPLTCSSLLLFPHGFLSYLSIIARTQTALCCLTSLLIDIFAECHLC